MKITVIERFGPGETDRSIVVAVPGVLSGDDEKKLKRALISPDAAAHYDLVFTEVDSVLLSTILKEPKQWRR